MADVKNQYLGLELVTAEELATASNEVYLRIVQPEFIDKSLADFLDWDPAVSDGVSLEMQMWAYEQWKSYCDDKGSLPVKLQIYRKPVDMVYKLTASYGTLSDEPTLEIKDVNESVTVEMDSSLVLDPAPVGDVSAEWEGDVLSESGETLNPVPKIICRDGVLTWGGITVDGVIHVIYESEFDEWTLTIPPRAAGNYDETKPETKYQSTVRAVYLGNVKRHEVVLPDLSGNCSGGVETIIDPDDDDNASCYRKVRVFDPCLEEEVEVYYEVIPCPEDEE